MGFSQRHHRSVAYGHGAVMKSLSQRIGILAYGEVIRLLRRPSGLFALLYGVIWGGIHGLIPRAPEPPAVTGALMGPSWHPAFLAVLSWVSFPIAFLLGVGSPLSQGRAWWRYIVPRQRQRIAVWLAIMGARVSLAGCYGISAIIAAAAAESLMRGSLTLPGVPAWWLIGGVLGAVWWADALLVTFGKTPLALGIVLVANYGIIMGVGTGEFAPSFLAPALGPTLAAMVMHHHGACMAFWTLLTVCVGYGIGFYQFRSLSI